jgi:prepilin-type processing-associated H-X9-DG protein
MRCTKQMRAIGQAIFLYANENRCALPPALTELIVTQDITPEIFICPSSDDTRSPGNSMEQVADNLSAGGHLSYIYCGNARTVLWDPKTVLLYEPMTNHGDGFHALFADGHSEFLSGPSAQMIQAELRSGQNPPPSHR